MPDEINKPSSNEEEYFLKLEKEKLDKRREQAAAEAAKAQRDATRTQCYMKCPKDGAELAAITYQGVVIDKCPECQGIWFDHGEGRQILEREAKKGGGLLMGMFNSVIGGKKEQSPL